MGVVVLVILLVGVAEVLVVSSIMQQVQEVIQFLTQVVVKDVL